MEKYFKPLLRVFSTSELTEVIGPAQMQSATMNVYGGRTAQLNNNHPAEYRIAKVEINYGVLNQKEVYDA